MSDDLTVTLSTVASGFSQDTAEDAVFRDSDPFFVSARVAT